MYVKKPPTLLVIGGNDAGLSAAGRAKRRNQKLDVVVLEKTRHCGYASCGLSMLISGEASAENLAGPDPDTLEKERGFTIRTRHQAEEINPAKRTVQVRNLDTGEVFEMNYHKLVLATGAKPHLPPALPKQAGNCFSLRSFQDAQRLFHYMQSAQPRSALVIGASYLGLEMAQALNKRGLQVSIVEQNASLFPDFDRQISEQIEQKLTEQGISLHLDDPIGEMHTKDGRIRTLSLENSGRSLATDLVFAATGIRPQVALAEQAGIPLGPTGAIRTSRYMQTGRLDIYACGDCAESVHLVSKNPVWTPFAGVASKMGRVAGDHISGGRFAFPGSLGSALLAVGDMQAGITGLSLAEAEKAGFDAESTLIKNPQKAGYVASDTPILIALITQKRTHRILGAQVFGTEGAALRLNVLATAIAAKMSAKDVAYLDLGYIPQVSPVWDPVTIAANVALK